MLKNAFFVLFLLASLTAMAGSINKTVSGSILGEDQEALAGAKIEVEGTEVIVYTDLDGNFSIKGLKPGKYNLIVSYVSYQELEIQKINLDYRSDKNLTLRLNKR